MARVALAFVTLLTLVSAAPAQHGSGAHAPYAGLEQRPVKALSAEQIADLRAARDEPRAGGGAQRLLGASHVLELADQLSPTDAQRARTQSLFDSMKREAVELGETLIAQETELDRQFSARSIKPAALVAGTDAIEVAS